MGWLCCQYNSGSPVLCVAGDIQIELLESVLLPVILPIQTPRFPYQKCSIGIAIIIYCLTSSKFKYISSYFFFTIIRIIVVLTDFSAIHIFVFNTDLCSKNRLHSSFALTKSSGSKISFFVNVAIVAELHVLEYIKLIIITIVFLQKVF